MSASPQLAALRNLLREKGLGSSLPAAEPRHHPPAPSGFAELDRLLDGGFPRGQLSEITGAASSGRTSLAAALLAEATARGEVAAYIDASDSFDPESASKAGVVLDRLLWVRCGPPQSENSQANGRAWGGYPRQPKKEPGSATSLTYVPEFRAASGQPRRTAADQAWQAVNLVAAAGGFGAIVLDLGGFPPRRLRPLQSRPWIRLRHTIEHTPTALLMVTAECLAGSVPALVLELSRAKTRWAGKPGVSLLLEGIATEVCIAQQRRQTGPAAAKKNVCRLEMGT